MNKGDLINKVSEVLNSKKEAYAAVDCMIAAINEPQTIEEFKKQLK